MTPQPPDPTSFYKYSRQIGLNPAYIQGGGGNTSLKLNEDSMLIKSSGCRLAEVGSTFGFSSVSHAEIVSYLSQPASDDDSFAQDIVRYTSPGSARPSIETALHSLMDVCVVHTHSVFANILTCSQEGSSMSKELFPDSIWIEYETPGRDVTLALRRALLERQGNDSLVFLENHGIITAGKNTEEAFNLHESTNQKIIKHLGIDKTFDDKIPFTDLEYMKSHVFFPDQVVYTLSGDELAQSKAGIETLAAYRYIHEAVINAGLTHQFLPESKVAPIMNMESEKYRQKLAKDTTS